MLRREAILRRASVQHFKRKIRSGVISSESFRYIEPGTANLIVKEMYDGNVEKWLNIVNNMGFANPKIFDYMIDNKNQFVKDYVKTL